MGAYIRDTLNRSVLLTCTILADIYTTGMTVLLMGFALEPLDCLLHYDL